MLAKLKWSDTDNFYMNLGCHKGSIRLINLSVVKHYLFTILYNYFFCMKLIKFLQDEASLGLKERANCLSMRFLNNKLEIQV